MHVHVHVCVCVFLKVKFCEHDARAILPTSMGFTQACPNNEAT